MTHGGPRPGAGRKPDSGEPKTRRLEIRVTDAELAELLDAAGDRPVSTWLLAEGLKAARRRR